MPKLNAIVENLDDVPDTMRDFYTETKDKDDKTWFVLGLEEDVKSHPLVVSLQRAHEAQKAANRDLRNKMIELETKIDALPEGWNAEEWNRLIELEKQIKEKGGEDDPEKKARHEAEIQSVRKMHEQQVLKINKQMLEGFKERDDKILGLNGKIQHMIIRDGLVRNLAEVGVKKEALPFVQAKLEKSIKVVEDEDDGEFKAVVDTDMGELPIDQFISKWANSDEAKLFVEPATGGGAIGGKGQRSGGDTNPWTKSHWDMRRQADILQKDAARADRMAKAAGHPKAPGALQMDAK